MTIEKDVCNVFLRVQARAISACCYPLVPELDCLLRRSLSVSTTLTGSRAACALSEEGCLESDELCQ
jgi:hypothetical protein